ncbi:MAG: hypothetical protein EB034_22850, partial [Verrucomicrobia bacterium]|nr:hypothetical protein [Verrucomicrobiota bacterium]
MVRLLAGLVLVAGSSSMGSAQTNALTSTYNVGDFSAFWLPPQPTLPAPAMLPAPAILPAPLILP